MSKRKTPLPVACLVLALLALPPTGGHALAQSDAQYFSATDQTVRGRFLEYWEAHGSLQQQGYPISGELREKSEIDGKVYKAQYFERAVFELHPENPAPNDVLLSLLGVFEYQHKYPSPSGAPGQQPNTSSGSTLFKETGKRVGGVFLDYWQTHGGLAQQGYPISEEFQEKSDLDGKTYTVQYFERAVFEMHPENQPPFNVLLSQLGTFAHKPKTGSPVTFVTQDGLTLGGLVYGRGTTAVVLSHSCVRRGKAVWNEIAQSLASVGYMVLTYDFRGFGDSKSGTRTASNDPHTYILDLQAAVAFARKQGATRLVLGGGSCGGAATLKVAVSAKPDAVIVLAAPVQFYDMVISDDELRSITALKLFVSSEDDPLAKDILHMYDVASEPKQKRIYPGAAHATSILDTDSGDDLMNLLMTFVQASAPVAALR
ncbi:MAG: hypothetical protein QOH93_3400 [Chloroflexia bacterium]|nr:hypothetical protein [Chloroflexia bacterium]